MALRRIGDLFAEVHGSGRPAVVALHGWARRGADFAAVLQGMDAVALDLPGFGATPAPEGVMTTAEYADQVASAIDDVGGGAKTIVGHSFGGRVAVRLAVRRHDLVERLVLTGVPLVRLRPPGRPPLGYRLLRTGHRFGMVSDERMERIRRSRGSVDYRSAGGTMRDILVAAVNESYEDDLHQIECPVDLVWGADDSEVPAEVAERVRTILDDRGVPTRLVVVPGAGHLLPLEAPEALRGVIAR